LSQVKTPSWLKSQFGSEPIIVSSLAWAKAGTAPAQRKSTANGAKMKLGALGRRVRGRSFALANHLRDNSFPAELINPELARRIAAE
jgi:hypothetical protein